nr:MAG TPA: cysteine-rich protein [Caudoviricetes sp.]
MLQTDQKCGTLLPVIDGYAMCPDCLQQGRRNRLQEITPDMQSFRQPLFCRKCKRRYVVNIAAGQCLEDRSR